MASEDAQAREKAKAAVAATLERYHLIVASRPNAPPFDLEVMKNAKIIDADPKGEVVFHLEITPYFTNINDVMHGGAIAVTMDILTACAICPLARPNHWEFLAGVTRSLNLNYLRGVPIGTAVAIRAKTEQCGRTMAFIRGSMTSLDGETVYVTAEHHKVNVPSKEAHMAVRVGWDEGFEREFGRRKGWKL